MIKTVKKVTRQLPRILGEGDNSQPFEGDYRIEVIDNTERHHSVSRYLGGQWFTCDEGGGQWALVVDAYYMSHRVLNSLLPSVEVACGDCGVECGRESFLCPSCSVSEVY